MDNLRQNKKIKYAIWGCGRYMVNMIHKIPQDMNILYFCDSDYKNKNDKYTYGGKEYECSAPEVIETYSIDIVIVAVQSENVVKQITERLAESGVSIIHINELFLQNKEKWEEEQIKKYDLLIGKEDESSISDKLVAFLSVNVPIDYCNLQCEYCYVGQNHGFFEKNTFFFSPQFIRRAFSRKRLNGTALINFCGTGETLLCDELIDIVAELLDEGHYISIITNAVVTKNINKLLALKNVDHLFFKCSFHYIQLLKGNRLKTFEENIRRIKESGASYSIELVPHDNLIPYINEIIEYSRDKFGALPHVTVARDEATTKMQILTKLSVEEYEKCWSIFDSKMFSFKMSHLNKQKEYCIAGRGTYLIDLCNGGTRPCAGGPEYTNVYDNIEKPICQKEVGNSCSCEYCFNNHAYFTLGMVKDIGGYSYTDIRDRKCCDGTFWLNEKMRNIFDQRICDNLEE